MCTCERKVGQLRQFGSREYTRDVDRNATTAELFIKGLEQILRSIHSQRLNLGTAGSPLQAVAAIRKQREEHEEQRRRVAKTIANGARLSKK